MTAIDHTAVTLDPEEARRVRQERLERIGRWLLPLAIMVLAIWLWDRICVWND
ncbi:MAG: ABC transporter permease, partial [Mesorhizobium sp.]